MLRISQLEILKTIDRDKNDLIRTMEPKKDKNHGLRSKNINEVIFNGEKGK